MYETGHLFMLNVAHAIYMHEKKCFESYKWHNLVSEFTVAFCTTCVHLSLWSTILICNTEV